MRNRSHAWVTWVAVLLVGSPLEAQVRPRGEVVEGQPYEKFETQDRHGRSVRFFVSTRHRSDPDAKLPLVLYVQGSSMASHFVERDGRIVGISGHNTIADAFRGRGRVLLVDKVGTPFLSDGRRVPSKARHDHTLSRWCDALAACLRAARRSKSIDSKRTLVVGHSEGGLVACKLAADLAFVTHVASLAGGAGSQLYDILELARQGTFFRSISKDPEKRFDYVRATWQEIRMQPDAEKAWFGHSYRRWASFLATSPLEQLAKTSAAIFIAQGGRDAAVVPATFDTLRAQLLAWGKPHEAHWFADADHSFRSETVEPKEGWPVVMKRLAAWFDKTPSVLETGR